MTAPLPVPACEPGEDVPVRAWVCVGNARLASIADYGVHGIAPFGPRGGDLFVPDPTAEIKRYEPCGVLAYDWGVGEYTAGIQWEERSGGAEWIGYHHADDEDSECLGDDLDEALKWLRAHPPGEWVATCADAGTRRAIGRAW